MQYALTNIRVTEKILKKLKVGSTLKIKHEPKNKFDNYACCLYFEDCKLGYVPKDYSKSIIQLAQKNRLLSFVVTQQVDLKEYHESMARPQVMMLCY